MSPNYSESDHILFISSYPPRRCGIATFTEDLTNAFRKKFNPVLKTDICALDNGSVRCYGKNILFQINASELGSYVSLAQKVNLMKEVKIVNIQHEFGLFGGEMGDYIIPFLQALEKPAITTFHSVISEPDKNLKKTVISIANKSKAIVVMNKISGEVLQKDYQIPKSKIFYIPHGIPQVAREINQKHKKALGFENRIVLSTFGFVSKNKGIEFAIRALPKIIRKFPNVIYLILGETHPVVKKKYGEQYRNHLKREIKKLGLEKNVRFYDKYLTTEELINFLMATDVYISSSIDERQSVSGTLSYALGCAKPSVSAATEYAKHIIKNGENGFLVKIKNSEEIAEKVICLLSDKKLSREISSQAYRSTRPMIWPNVAESYLRLFKRFAKLKANESKFPEIKFDHILKLTDSFGIVQHANYNKPNKKFGYSSDDVSRALIASVRHYKNHPAKKLEKLIKIYLDFLKFARRENGSFANIISYPGKVKDKTIEEDVQGRVIWALGYSSSMGLPKAISEQALKLFKKAVLRAVKLKAPRSIAFALAGLYYYLNAYPQDAASKKLFKGLAEKLAGFYRKNSCPDWTWFESFFTYSNSILPEALFYAYIILKQKKYLEIAKSSLHFLESITFSPDFYIPIGQKGWYFKNGQRSYFDQQPEDAASMAQTEILAYKTTKEKKYLKNAVEVFQWFLGGNYLNQMIYDEVTGGCNDGLGEQELNLNQGAESTISYLMARLCFEEEEIKKDLNI